MNKIILKINESDLKELFKISLRKENEDLKQLLNRIQEYNKETKHLNTYTSLKK